MKLLSLSFRLIFVKENKARLKTLIGFIDIK
jgi:hypothetical protein